MTKHAKKSAHLQAIDQPKTMAVEIPLPFLGAFANIENSFFDLCIDAGQQVLAAMMEQDREDLFGYASRLRHILQQQALSRGDRKRYAGRCLLRMTV